MAALTGNVLNNTRPGQFISLPVYNGVHIYVGALVATNSSGYAIPLTSASGNKFFGVSVEEQDNTSGSAGALNVKVQIQPEVVVASHTSATATNVGDVVSGVNDGTVAFSTTTTVGVGIVTEVISSTQLRVLCKDPASDIVD